jgi:hypothetical protein
MSNPGGQGEVAGDAGEVTLDYLALATALIVIVGSLMLGGSARVVEYGFEQLWCTVGSLVGSADSCAFLASPVDAAYLPDCESSSETTDVTYGVKVLVVKLDSDTTMTKTLNADGTVQVSIADGGDAGVEVGFGAKGELETGKGSFKPGAEATAGVQLTTTGTQTWDFANAAEAAKFSDTVTAEFASKVTGQPIVGWLYKQITGSPSLPPPSSVTVAAGGNGYADASANVPIVAQVSAGVSAGIELSITTGTEAGKAYSERELAVDLSGTASGDLFGAEVGGKREGIGVMTIRYDDQGRATQVSLKTTQTGDFDATLKQPPGLKDFAGLKKLISASAGGGASSTVEVTTTIDLDSPQKQALYNEWNKGVGVTRAASSAWDALWGGDPGVGANGVAGQFGDLLRQQGKTSVVTYVGDTVNFGGGVEGKVGVEAGLDVSVGHQSQKATNAHYLGAPDATGNRELVNLPGCIPK